MCFCIKRARVFGLLAASVGSLSIFKDATAAEWQLTPSIDVSVEYDTNGLLSILEEIELAGARARPSVEVTRETERSKISIDADADFRGYQPDERLSSVNQSVEIAAERRFERSEVGFNARFSRDTLLENVEDNFGDFGDASRVRTVSASPRYYRILGEKSRFDISGNFSERRFESDRLLDYRYYSMSSGISRLMSENDLISVILTLALLDPQDQVTPSTEVYAAQLQWQRTLSDRFEFSLAAGPEFVRRDAVIAELDPFEDVGFRANAEATYAIGPLTDATLKYARLSEPTGLGAAISSDRFGLAIGHRLNERMKMSMTASYLRRRSSVIGAAFAAQSLVLAEPTFSWRLDERANLSVSYRFRQQQFATNDDDAQSHRVRLAITNKFRTRTWSE